MYFTRYQDAKKKKYSIVERRFSTVSPTTPRPRIKSKYQLLLTCVRHDDRQSRAVSKTEDIFIQS